MKTIQRPSSALRARSKRQSRSLGQQQPRSGMNGILDWLTGGGSDDSVGLEVLSAYFNEAVKYPEFSFSDYDSWIAWATAQVPDFQNFVGSLVNMNSASTTADQAATRLTALANNSGGQATLPQIVSSAGGNGDSINWAVAIPSIATQTTADVAAYAATVAQNVGTGVMGTLSLVQYLPWILGGAAALYIFTIAKTQGGSLSRLTDAAAARLKKNPRRRRGR